MCPPGSIQPTPATISEIEHTRYLCLAHCLHTEPTPEQGQCRGDLRMRIRQVVLCRAHGGKVPRRYFTIGANCPVNGACHFGPESLICRRRSVVSQVSTVH